METKETVEFKFSYKKPEEELYSLWVEDCAYSFNKEAAQELVTHMKEHWPGLDYGVKKEVKKYSAEEMVRAVDWVSVTDFQQNLQNLQQGPYSVPRTGWRTKTAKELAKKKGIGIRDYQKLSDSCAVEHIGQYRGFDYCVYFLARGFRTAYVLFEEKYKDDDIQYIINYVQENSKEPHGCITWKKPLEDPNEYAIGFDACHAYDGVDPQRGDEIFGNDSSPEAEAYKYFRHARFFYGAVRSKEFMIDECHQLIDAIIEALEEKKDSGPSDLKQSF